MQKLMMISLAAVMGLSQAAFAAESQNPHDPSNQGSDANSDIHADTNVDTGSPNPNSLGRTGRSEDINNMQRNTGVQTLPSNQGNISDRIEDINDDDRQLHDRLDGRQSPTVDPAFNSDGNPATPVLPPGQGPGVSTDTGTDSSATSRSDVAPRANPGAGSRAVSGSGTTNGTGTGGTSGGTGGTSSGGSSGGGSASGGGR